MRFLFLFLLAAAAASAQTIAVTGNWSLSLSTADLSGGPGTDFPASRTSLDSQVTIDISGTTGARAWFVDVRMDTTEFDAAGLSLYVLRTGAGTGTGSVAAGDTEVLVTGADTEFFNGARPRTGIPIRLRVDGLSVGLGVDTIATTVTYTVHYK